jgi:hypothetical protein
MSWVPLVHGPESAGVRGHLSAGSKKGLADIGTARGPLRRHPTFDNIKTLYASDLGMKAFCQAKQL